MEEQGLKVGSVGGVTAPARVWDPEALPEVIQPVPPPFLSLRTKRSNPARQPLRRWIARSARKDSEGVSAG
jgi:hypothetical protein